MDDDRLSPDSALQDLTHAAERDGVGMARFAGAATGPTTDVDALVLGVFVTAYEAARSGDDAALSRPRLFAALRKRCAHVESSQKRPAEPVTGVRALLSEVRPSERDAVLLRAVAGLAFPDVGAACGTDESSARERASRALCRLAGHSAATAFATSEITAKRREVEARLTEVLDGVAPDDLARFIAEDDVSRDLVHDAERVMVLLGELEEGRTLHPTAIVDEVTTRVVDTKVASDAPPEPIIPELLPRGAAPQGSAAEPRSRARDADRPTPHRDPIGEASSSRARSAGRRSGLVFGALAVLGALAWYVSHREKDTGRFAGAAWSGTVTDVARAFGDGAGLERCSPDRAVCSPVDRGDDVPAGSTLRTDGSTRAVITLRDGSRLILDRDSELRFDGELPRRARLDHGSIVAEVARLASSSARVDLPLGFVEAEAVKASLAAASSGVEVEVVRGELRLVDASERGVEVHAGEAGRIEPSGPPEVYPTATLGGGLGWSERAFAPPRSNDEDLSGLGELRAKKPGEDQERKGAVSLASHSTRVRIVGNVARTEIEETFTNATDEVLEGIYRFPLPPGAQIERLALDVEGRLEEGAFVDRDRAASIWNGAIVNAGGKKQKDEEIVWVPGPWRDPALLEWQRGGRFELRIFPIPKRGSRRVILAYTEVIRPSGAVRRYVYPLPHDPSGSTRVGSFDVDIQVRGQDKNAGVRALGYELRQSDLPDGATALSMTKTGFSPNGDLSVEFSLPDADREVTAWAYQPSPDETKTEPIAVAPSGGAAPLPGVLNVVGPSPLTDVPGSPYVALSLRPKLPRSEDRVLRTFALVVDSSRSMFGERYRRASELATRIVEELDSDDRVTVLACDSTCRELPSRLGATGPGAARLVSEFLGGITPEGGSDIALAVRGGRDALRAAPPGTARVVYIGDGTPTIGPVSPAFMRREIEAAVPHDTGTVSAVAIGSDADVATLGTIAGAGGGVVVPYTPGQSTEEAAYAVLGATYGTTLADAEVSLPDGLVEVAPRRVSTIAAGGEAMIVARMVRPTIDGTLTLRGRVGGAAFEQRYPLHLEATTAKGNAFVPRLWAAAQIAELEQEPDAQSRARVVELSGRFHVASRYTSLLVLESEAMFQAFGLAHAAQAPVFTGEDDATSTSADGELAVADPQQQTPVFEKAKGDDKDDLERSDFAGSLGSSAGAASAGRGGMAGGYAMPKASVAPAKRARAESEMAEDGPPSGNFAPPPPAAAAAPSPMPTEESDQALQVVPSANPLREPLGPSHLWPGRRMVPMRKVWDRIGRIVTPASLPNAVTADAIAQAERDAQANDLRRDAVKHLYTLYFLAGNVDRAGQIAETWSAKDPLDPDALTARADVAAARGQRELAIRILGSVVDVRPGDHKSQWRLARLHRWAGDPELGCRSSMAVAQIRVTDAKLLAEAVRCERDLGHADVASDLLTSTTDATRRATEALLVTPAADPTVLLGDLRLDAVWDGGDDLDLSMLPSDGNRVSWLGAPTRAIITAHDVESPAREGLALQGASPGDYVIEITRPAGHSGIVRGTIDIVAVGERRTVPFVLQGENMRVALVKIGMKSRLVSL